MPNLTPEAGNSLLDDALDSPARLAALSKSGLMDSAPEPGFDRLTALATRLLKAPVSLVSLVDDQRQFFKSSCGLDKPRETPLSHSFCQHVVMSRSPLVVVDARDDARVAGNGAIADLNVIAYLGIPLIAPDGASLGSFCAIDSEPRDWSQSDIEIMSDLAAAVQTEIALRMALKDRDRIAGKHQLLMGELDHRIKNLFAMVSGMVGISARNADSPQHMADVLRGRIEALSQAHALIRPAIDGDGIASESSVDLPEVARAILAPHGQNGTVRVGGPAMALSPKPGAQLSVVLHELATNASKYGALSLPGGLLTLSWTIAPDTVEFDWIEHNDALALGDPEQFGKGFGMRLITSSVRQQMGGTIDYDWSKTGVRVSIRLPRDRIEMMSAQSAEQ